MTDFDDILKKAKKSVGGTPSDPDTIWKEAIGGVLYALHALNDLYQDPKQHFIQSIERARCHKCSRVTYLLSVFDLVTNTSSLKFHSSSWKAITQTTYECDQCQGP